ncbi:MAG: N-succinyl-L,L-diaminopimelate desuccinylase [uncultured Thermoleophilia bacterium]|uniref:Succinyl-diaminopimelate desuccinylase n=1 Tax=uncultured Thermoleophilia bacterium TaxID=1497501 RepID=A0A6J4UAT5_9ACTN|nr:MAG: N-succinyl-L,L-diaminopimelate desuccinylase [uncultured Thermoleophilia bacterium]
MAAPSLTGSVADICLTLVATPTPTGHEEPLTEAVLARCRALEVPHERLGNAVVARTGGDGEPVALVGHLDTVPNWDGGGAALEGERVVGRGASDMKGGVAVMLRLLDRFARRGRPVVHVFYDREEGPHLENGIHRVLEESRLLGRPGLAVVLEPTAGTIHAGAVGTLNAEVVFRGAAAHAARPWEGRNAVTAGGPALLRFGARERRAVEVDGLTYYDVVTVTTAVGGAARNVVPDRFALGVNVRYAPGRSAAEARAEVAALAGPEAEIAWLDDAAAALPALDAPAVAAFLRRTGLEVRPKQAWTDVATLSAAGIPAVNYGPGDPAQAHQRGEWVSVPAMERCEDVLAEFLTDGA